MAATTPLEPATGTGKSPWQGFRGGLWQKEINVRDFIQQNCSPYEGDGSFLRGATARTRRIWDKLQALFVEERRKGVLDVSQTPGSITAYAPGYIDRDNEVIVGLQTDAPLKRGILPNGGIRLVVSALEAYGYEPDPKVLEIFTKYRKTHNDAVFDAYTADARRCRSSHILTGLPDAYGRGRIIGDYRRVALYGVARLIKRKEEEKSALDAQLDYEVIDNLLHLLFAQCACREVPLEVDVEERGGAPERHRRAVLFLDASEIAEIEPLDRFAGVGCRAGDVEAVALCHLLQLPEGADLLCQLFAIADDGFE